VKLEQVTLGVGFLAALVPFLAIIGGRHILTSGEEETVHCVQVLDEQIGIIPDDGENKWDSAGQANGPSIGVANRLPPFQAILIPPVPGCDTDLRAHESPQKRSTVRTFEGSGVRGTALIRRTIERSNPRTLERS
jgi:hypothetical protein